MKKQILIHKVGKKSYRADSTWKPGSPSVGSGDTRLKALIDLLSSADFGLEVVIDDDGNAYDFKGRYNAK